LWAALLLIICVQHISSSKSSGKALKSSRSKGHSSPPSKTSTGGRRKSGHAQEKDESRGDVQELRRNRRKRVDRSSSQKDTVHSRGENDDGGDDGGRGDRKEKERRQDPERETTTTLKRGIMAAANKKIASLGRKKKLSEAQSAFDDVKLVHGIQQDVVLFFCPVANQVAIGITSMASILRSSSGCHDSDSDTKPPLARNGCCSTAIRHSSTPCADAAPWTRPSPSSCLCRLWASPPLQPHSVQQYAAGA